MTSIRRAFNVYGSFAAMMPKMFLAYSSWVWMQFIVQVIALVIFVAFWRAVYAEQSTIGGLGLQDTLNYIILAQIFLPAVNSAGVIYFFGHLMRDGLVGIELLRPLDFQTGQYVSNTAQAFFGLLTQLPLALVAWLLFRFQIPGDPLVWLSFLLTLLLGNALVFYFNWILGCVSFYSTETWGLSVLHFAVSTFFSGSLIPLVMMPGWLRTIAEVLPFSQALYVPVSVLSGITPLADLPRLWGVQIVYLTGMIVLSRIIFKAAVRKVTVQGG